MEIAAVAIALVLVRASSLLPRSQTIPLLRATLLCTRPLQLALQHNHIVHIAGYKVEEKQHAKEVAKSAYFPTIRNESNFIHLTDTQLIQISAGSLGRVAGSPIPPVTSTINQGGRDLTTSGTQLTQPLTTTAKNPVR